MNRQVRLSTLVCVVLALGAPVVGQPAQQSVRYGTITSMESTIITVRPGSGGGAQVGATVGAVAGYALADGGNRWLGGLLGGALGGVAGNAAGKSAAKKKGWQLIVKLESTGEEIGVPVVGKKKQHEVGERVRLLTGPGGETQVSRADAAG